MKNGITAIEGLAGMTEPTTATHAGVFATSAKSFINPPLEGAPLTAAQRHVWLLEELHGAARHHLMYRMDVDGPLDSASLEKALAGIVERHESLRTTYAVKGGEAVQFVSDRPAFHLPRVDLAVLTPAAQQDELDALADMEASHGFDLRNELLLRARLVHLGATRHALFFMLHPIAADAGSLPIFCQELDERYAAACAGDAATASAPAFGYTDYARRQHEHLRGDTRRRLVHFWREHLAGAPPLLELPADRPRPPVQSGRGASCTRTLPRNLAEHVRVFARDQGATPFMILLAVFKTLLHRHTGQEDLVVGHPIDGRAQAGTERLIGLFANTLVMRTHLDGDPTFQELLERVRQTVVSAGEHPELLFETLVEELQPSRDLGREPLCQVFFSVHEAGLAAPQIGGARTRLERVGPMPLRGDLELTAELTPEGLHLDAAYDPKIFDAGTIERLLGHFETLLSASMVAPEKTLSALPMLTPAEKTRLLTEWNDTATPYDKTTNIHRLFEEQAERTPEATAVVFDDQELSYSALNRLAEGVARRLRARGAGPETLVALCAERSLEMIVGLLGILKSGAAYVPLDPAFPRERLHFMMEDSEAPMLVTQRHLQPLFPGCGSVLLLDEPDNEPAAASPLAADAGPENLAYLLYTSGSTGKPKGVMVKHGNVLNFFLGMDAVVGSEPGVWLAVTSISFDISVLELLWTLVRGAKVVILADHAGFKNSGGPRPGAGVTRTLDEQMIRHGITHLQCTPCFARLLTRMPETMVALRSIRRFVVGGEALPADLARILAASIDGALVNLYGPTETTVWSAAHPVKSDELRGGTVDVGRPIANTQIYILDRHGRPVPVGVHGEIHIGGDGLARGYWRRPELTAEKFVTGQFIEGRPRLYRTGDLGRFRADGVIEFCGRADHQVKIRGYRIEPGEIEAVLATHPDVRQSVVVARADDPQEPRLVAYVVPAVDGGGDIETLRRLLRAQLPDHMVPQAIMLLERLPLTPNGKVDRKALPEPARARADAGKPYVAPRTATEEVLTAIWRGALRREQVGIEDNFFDLGGGSLLATQVLLRVREAFQVELPLRRFFESPVISDQAAVIEAVIVEEIQNLPACGHDVAQPQ